jgi:hypothetical protein
MRSTLAPPLINKFPRLLHASHPRTGGPIAVTGGRSQAGWQQSLVDGTYGTQLLQSVSLRQIEV